jgi:hypothetical protein
MSESPRWTPVPTPGSNFDHLAQRAGELRRSLRGRSPASLAGRTGSEYFEIKSGRGEFRLSLWSTAVHLSYPELVACTPTGEELPSFLQAMLLYYFQTASGAEPSGEWISFADLPDGRLYNRAFQGYTGGLLGQAFGDDLDAFRESCQSRGGLPYDWGDAAFLFQALPRLSLLVVYWLGDEDFPPVCKLLFQASASHYLPTDACAILGSMLARKLLPGSPRQEGRDRN